MSVILGISPFFINNSITLLVDGEIIYACEEERLNREKKTRKFPVLALRDALLKTGISIEDVDIFAISVNAGIYLEQLDISHSSRLRYRGELLYSVPNYLMSLMDNNIISATRQEFEFINGEKFHIDWVEHHLAHAASTFFTSPFESAAILTVDGFGEKSCVLFSRGKDHQIEPLYRQEFPHSIGCFYAALTEFMGFRPECDEWKVMGAAANGDPERFYQKLSDLIFLKNNGGFELELSYFNFYQFHRPKYYTPKFIDYLGIKPNSEPVDLSQDYYDLSAAVQKVTEDVYFHMLNKLYEQTNEDYVCLAGGVAFNSVANGKIVSNTPFKDVFIPPMPDDSGTSLGAALYIHHHVQGNPKQQQSMIHNYWGPGYDNEEIEATLKRYKTSYKILDNPAEKAAQLIFDNKIIGWFQGRLEFGDRALGNRSILADARDAKMKDKVNETIKYREPFRPFAPSILQEYLDEYFIEAAPTPFMEKVFPIKPDKHAIIPAVTHIDGSGRLQTVNKEQNLLYYELIHHFYQLSGVPIILNTSFNLNGEPIVSSPKDAIRTFITSGLDALIIGNFLVIK